MRRPLVVVDLGLGDAGKGLLTDALVRRHGAGLVVRFNGGAQAGHTVVTADGRWHTFSQLGAGSFVPGVRTHLAEPVLVHPTALGLEAEALARVGVPDALARLSVDDGCRVITPFHQAANRLRELWRGTARHGSCGVGVGEAVADDLAHPGETIRWADLADPARAARAAARVQERKRSELAAQRGALAAAPQAAAEGALLDDAGVPARWAERCWAVAARARRVPRGGSPPGWNATLAVFEGAQGVLLDEAAGFHPYTTWSCCLPRGAGALVEAWGGPPPFVWGVTRVHLVRHGPGPLPTECAALGALPEPHNREGPWQGAVRKGWLDLTLLAYALGAAAPIDAIALTHCDALGAALPWAVGSGYHGHGPAGDELPWPGPAADLAGAERRTRWLDQARPRLEPVEGGDADARARSLAARVAALGVPVGATAWGPRAGDVRFRADPTGSAPSG